MADTEQAALADLPERLEAEIARTVSLDVLHQEAANEIRQLRAALAGQAVPAKWVDAVCSAAFDEEGWVIDPDLAEVHAEMLAAKAAKGE